MNQDNQDLLSNTRHLIEVFAADFGGNKVSPEMLQGTYDNIRVNMEELVARYWTAQSAPDDDGFDEEALWEQHLHDKQEWHDGWQPDGAR